MLRPSRATSTGPDDLTTELVKWRFYGRCCRCGEPGETIQHRIPRGMGGSRHNPRINLPSNLLWVCGDGTRKCHGHMERERTEAYENGWLVPRETGGLPTDPSTVEVLLWDGRRVLLDNEGEAHPAAPHCPSPRRDTPP